MAASTHRVEIVPVKLEKHPNADSLSIVRIEGYQVVTRTDGWDGCEEVRQLTGCEPGTMSCMGAYIPPDSLVPVDREEFSFLKDPKKPDQKMVRVKAKKLRGEWSMGLLIHAPNFLAGRLLQVGDDVAALLGVEHYEPPEPSASTSGETEKAPRKVRKPCPSCHGHGFVEDPQHGHSLTCEPCGGKGYPNDAEAVPFDYPKYDVEAFRKYGRIAFEPGEPVWVTEKIHGANGRWLFDGERFYCGSHKEWKRESKTNLWWKVLRQYPALQNFLHMNPGTAVYGEVYGQVQDLKYGTKPGEIRLAVFDILHEGKWVSAEDSQQFCPNPNGPPAFTLPWVPQLLNPDDCCEPITFNFDALLALAEGHTLVETIPWNGPKHCREGIVVKPLKERWHPKCGRVNLKIVSNQYLEKA